jgi:V/A-type H+/Na+-transporting ATPase subunit D
MAKKVPLTRVELKRQREELNRYERFLPALQRRQQQLQLAMQELDRSLVRVRRKFEQAQHKFERYDSVLRDRAGLDVQSLGEPEDVQIGSANVAGVQVPVFQGISFSEPDYSLFATPPWVDQALRDLRELTRHRSELRVLEQQEAVLRRELMRVVQRVNLFEKVKIPEARNAIRRIRITLGDAMAAAVGRAKIAKAKLTATTTGRASEGEEDVS